MTQIPTYEELEQRIKELKKEAFERKRVEEALEESETRYRRLFETAQDGILILDADTELIEDANPFILDMLGFSIEEMVGKRLWEIGPFRDIEASQYAFLELPKKEYIRYEHLPLETKDGRSITVEFISNVYLVNHFLH
jgi:PAS domain S-box-containing protein